MRSHLLAALALLWLAAPLNAQAKEFVFVPELKVDVSKVNLRRGGGMLTVGPKGQMVFLPEFYRSAIHAYDSTGRDLGWQLPIGRGANQEIGWVRRMGWIGDSLWVHDHMYDQVVVVDPAGRVARSLETPSWVRPGWGDRRRYPIFADMEWRGVLGDGSILVLPSRSRNIFDTPQFDRDAHHLVRADADGRILNTVARIPRMTGNLELRSGAERARVRVEHFAPTFWQVGNDGQRIAVVTPSRVDSGAFTVTVVKPAGDTVYSRAYRAAARKVSQGFRDSALAKIKPFGRHSAEAIRDTVDKLMSRFVSPVVNVSVGVDGAVWVWLREPGRAPNEWRAMILDPAGNVVGMTTLPRSFRAAEVSTDHLWAITRDGNLAYLERFRRAPATAARPARSARTSASSRP